LQGQEEAFDELVNRYLPKALAIARRFTNQVEDAQDLVQDTFLRAHQALGRYDERYAFSTWFYRILVNLCINFQKRKQRWGWLVPESADAKAELTASSTEVDHNPEAWQERQELREEIERALQSLSSEQRVVVTMYDLEGFTHREIAEILGCPVGTVMSRLHYGRLKLRKLLGPRLQRNP
jgi:RNA polymerase sigma-70 factor (ECF subfamily)